MIKCKDAVAARELLSQIEKEIADNKRPNIWCHDDQAWCRPECNYYQGPWVNIDYPGVGSPFCRKARLHGGGCS